MVTFFYHDTVVILSYEVYIYIYVYSNLELIDSLEFLKKDIKKKFKTFVDKSVISSGLLNGQEEKEEENLRLFRFRRRGKYVGY